MPWFLAVCLLLLAAATVVSDPTELLPQTYQNETSESEAHQADDFLIRSESGATSGTHTALIRTELSNISLTAAKDLSMVVLSTSTPSGWTITSAVSASSPACSSVATESSRIAAALGTALLIPCPPLNRTDKFSSISWTHTPTGSNTSRRANEQVVSSLTRRLFFAKDGTSLVIVAVREADAFQCTLFVSEDDCRSATISIDVQQCQSPEMNPCANGGNCSILLPSTPASAVDCLCVYGYRGPRCQNEISRGFWLIVLFWVVIVLEVALVYAGAYRFLQLRRVTRELTEDQDVPVYKLLAMAYTAETSAT